LGRGDGGIRWRSTRSRGASGRGTRWWPADSRIGGAALADWTAALYRDHRARHHLDVAFGGAIYRVFLLKNTLQVDLAFFPAAEFGATRPSFRLLFGAAVERPPVPPPAAERLIGYGWLYALHARSSIERGRLWQAEYMVSQVRDHVLALAALRHGLPAEEGRGLDRLPRAATAPLEAALVRALEAAELRRAFGVALGGLRAEIRHADAELAERLEAPLRELTDPAAAR
jgi:hypothetical protein